MDAVSRFLRYLFSGSSAPPSRLHDVLLNFSVDLHRHQLQLRDGGYADGNVFTSPFAIALALAATHAGSRSETASQLAQVLHLQDDLIDDVRKEFADMVLHLADAAPDVKVHLANGVAVDRGVRTSADFKDLLESGYDGSVKELDLRKNPQRSRTELNSWVEEKTKFQVADTLPVGAVTPNTSVLLVNAMYLKGQWDSDFKSDYTSRKPFRETRDKTSMVEMMFQRKNYKTAFCKTLDVNALEIPYFGKKVSMVILLPQKVDGLATLEANLTATNLQALLRRLCEDDDVELNLPKFKLEQSSSLRKVLESMGAQDLFTDRADLAGFTDSKGVRVSEVVHKAVLEIGEEGAEGVFATPVIMMCYGGASFNFNVDHPFMFLIRSCNPDVILFMGSVRHL
ncbi:hypothetical protein HPB47_007311 [Ixodes persulcatus]|uniref:Uncharacterized protein n=1 Tax=Ixodes persulcatus TaxID=34615 RepID=A0AC60P8A6_IXOPE|nr:hypothetical protein HPB47_007311 [Ixodes persulcatus]